MMYQACPRRQVERPSTAEFSSTTRADIAGKNPLSRRDGDETREKLDPSLNSQDHETVPHPPSADEPNTNTPSSIEEERNCRKGTRRRRSSNKGKEAHASDIDTGSDHTPHDETDTEMETQSMTLSANVAHPVFMNANGREETHVETAIDHGRADERPPESAESQDEITDKPGQGAKMETQEKTQNRTKKMKLENGEEHLQERKRNRTRASQRMTKCKRRA
jgi:hypothetical protein